MPILAGIPASIQSLFWPIVFILMPVMGIMLLISIANPGLKAAVKEHIGMIALAAILIFGGAGLAVKFLTDAGVPGAPTAPAVVRTTP